ncbi:MAG TPA: hypothetical protein DEH78_06715 [Solibacterales bacterium]|nr:hypothetical protein [Bryobacterales bacterium]
MSLFPTRVPAAYLFAAGAVIVAWGALGLYAGAQEGLSGGLYGPDYLAEQVPPGTGLQPGDRVISVEGIPVERLGMESRWPGALRPRAGESRRFVVDRKGARIPLDVVFPAPSRAAMETRLGAALFGVAFLLTGLWAYLGPATHATSLFAAAGLSVGLSASLGLGPHLGSWSGVPSHLSTTCLVVAAAVMLEFFLVYPKPRDDAARAGLRWVIYLPCAVLIAAFATELAVHPALYHKVGWLPDLLVLGYAALAVAAVAHTLYRTARHELLASGMYLIAVGHLLTIFAMIAAAAFGAPAWTYGAAALPAPLAVALALRRQTAMASAQPAPGGARG